MSSTPISEPKPLAAPDGLRHVAPDETARGGAMGAEPDLLLHWLLLALALAVIGLSMILRVRREDQVVLPVVDVALPGVCTYKRLVGTECPGCGLTRCFVSVGHGELGRAWHFNPAGIFLFLLVVVQVPYRAVQIWRIRRGLPEIRPGRLGYFLLWLFVIGLLVQWLARTITLLL